MDMELNMSDFASILYQQDIDLGVNWNSFEPVKSIKEKQFEEPVKPISAPPTQQYAIDGETGEFLPIPATQDVQTEQKQEQQTEIDEFLSFLGNMENKNEIDVSDLQSLIEAKSDEPKQTTQNLFDDMVEMSGIDFNENNEKQNENVGSDVKDIDMQWQFDYNTINNDGSQFVQQQHPNNSPPDQQMIMDFGFDDGIPIPMSDPPMDGPKNKNAVDMSMPGELFFNPNAEIRDVMDELQNLNNTSFMQDNDAYTNPPNAPFVPPPLGEPMSNTASMMSGSAGSPTLNTGNFASIITQNTYESDSGISADIDSETGLPTGGTYQSMLFDSDELTSQAQVYGNITNNISASAAKKIKKEKEENQRQSRDLKKAMMLNIPFSMDQIIHSSVEQYNAMLAQTKLTSEQQTLVRDIRRRGKNKVAAQNCRKRKIETISSLEKGVDVLNKKKEELIAQQQELEMKQDKLKENYAILYKQIFQSLRDENGKPYDPRHFRLEQVEGAIILAPVLGLAHSHGNNTQKASVKAPVTFFDLTKVKIEKPE